MAFCCVDGSVMISDIHTGEITRQWKEHQSRVWSLHCNYADPKIIASASNDFTVKAWSVDIPYSGKFSEGKIFGNLPFTNTTSEINFGNRAPSLLTKYMNKEY